MRTITALEAKVEAYWEEMERDTRIVMIGEDIAVQGGIWGQYKGFAQQFGTARIIQTSLNEAGHGMFGVGLAFCGFRPIVEFGMLEFSTYAFPSIVCEAAKQRYMTYGALSCPIVFTMPHGGGHMLGGNHSSYGESWFNNAPGLKVYAPLFPSDVKGLMKYAIREDDPVVFLESKESRMRGEIPDENTDQLVKPGKANILKAGSDVTIVGWQWGILKALEAADELADEGIDAEIIDIRTIVPLDTETIVNSCAKTGKLVVISESRRRGGFGNDIIAAVAELGYSELKGVHPMHYVCGKDYPLPFGYGEKYIMPDKDDLIAGVHRVLE